MNQPYGPNPFLDDDFIMGSLNCEPLVLRITGALGIGDQFPYPFSTYTEGGTGAYLLGGDCRNGHAAAFAFFKTTATEQPTAQQFLTFLAADETSVLFLVAERYSREFAEDLIKRWGFPVYLMQAVADEPWFVQVRPGLDGFEWAPAVQDSCPVCHHLTAAHPGGRHCEGDSLKKLGAEYWAQLVGKEIPW